MKKILFLALLITTTTISFSQEKMTTTTLEDGWHEASFSTLDSEGVYKSDLGTREWVYIHNNRITSIGLEFKTKNEIDALRLNTRYINGGDIKYKKARVFEAKIIYAAVHSDLLKTYTYQIKIPKNEKV